MENKNKPTFDENVVLEHLKHYLPSQAALKDFVHHNTLHAFQHDYFHDGLQKASTIFGYRTYLSLEEFRQLYDDGFINDAVLNKVIRDFLNLNNDFSEENFKKWKTNLLAKNYNENISGRVGKLHQQWKKCYNITIEKIVHPILFRLLAGFLDQGVTIWSFPSKSNDFKIALKELEKQSIFSLFKTKKVKELWKNEHLTIRDILLILVGKEEYFEQYLFDLQFLHPGWSGFVSVLEHQPETLLDTKNIQLKDVIILELLLELDAVISIFGTNWKPLGEKITENITQLFEPVEETESKSVFRLFQEAYEWTYFDKVLAGVKKQEYNKQKSNILFQAIFCIDDREYSMRRHLEDVAPHGETYGTPGFFGVEFYFLPQGNKFYTKVCPAPVTPKYLIKEKDRKHIHKHESHLKKQSHKLLMGWIYTNLYGFWSAVKLLLNIFRPAISSAGSYSFHFMDKKSNLELEYNGEEENGLQIGFKIEEMALRVKNTLMSIGLAHNFGKMVYLVGHGGSSVNNTYYAGYDCGACCGRPGAVNARVFAAFANKKEVREILKNEGLHIPDNTYFMGALHDTTRDEITFYDEENIPDSHLGYHIKNRSFFLKALANNAKERAFRFDLKKNEPTKKIHQEVKKRSVSLFEPRPEWNHTANALCIIGRKHLYKKVYLDKRPFINSYDYENDMDGKYLKNILNAAIPVCGGINLEYYFSRVDQEKLGSGTKLPHNVMGLFAVTNGVDGDLRTGLPSQMIEIHDPLRILYIVEHYPHIVENVIKSNPAVYEWIKNEWVLFSVIDPETRETYRFQQGKFCFYNPLTKNLKVTHNEKELESYYSKPIVVELNH